MRSRPKVLLVATAAVALAACTGSDDGGARRAAVALPTSSTLPDTTTAPVAPSTTEPVATTTTVPAVVPQVAPAPRFLSTGSTGPEVQAVEQRLADLKFDPGPVDGKFDAATAQAVLSFQKQAGLPRTSKVDDASAARLSGAPLGVPMVADGEPTRVEVDIERQVLQYWENGQLVRVIGVSTGNGRRYCEKVAGGGRACGVAITPTGRFRAERKINGLRRSDLGVLYDPVYFYRGFAVHGSPSVPAGPASHGCVRIPIRLSKAFNAMVKLNTQVVVLKGGAPPLPPSTPVPAPEPVAPPTPPTTAPPTTAPPTAGPSASSTSSTTRPTTTTTTHATTTTTHAASTTTTAPPVTIAP